MSQGQDHPEFLAARMMERIGEQPDIALTAADLLRQNPYLDRAEERVAKIQELHGFAIADMYQFMGCVIARSDAFSRIEFDPRVKVLAKEKAISDEQSAIAVAVGRRASEFDPSAMRVMELKNRSARAHKLYLAAKVLIDSEALPHENPNPPINLFNTSEHTKRRA